LKPNPKKKRIELKGKAYTELRKAACKRAMNHCEVKDCYQWTPIELGHLDHYPKTRGAGAGDTLKEVRWVCYRCHDKRHRGLI